MDHNPEFSRPVEAEKIPPRGMELEITARPEECAALAKRMGLLDIAGLNARLQLRRSDGGQVIVVDGDFAARVTQQCVVTLEPMPADIAETLHGLFAPPELVPADAGVTEITDVFAEDPEPIQNGVIDLGELTVQHLSLALDPYPRKPGVALPQARVVSNENGRENPFAKLKDLIKNDKE
ncbi:MAG: DUF177 domain-containing protein [Alphaproteobacteria bacterium]